MPTWPKRDPQHKSFNCCFEWHFRKSGLYIAVYNLIGNVTSGGQNSFFSSIEKVAEYFDANYETVRRVFVQLVKLGWLKRVKSPEGRTAYFWVSHERWEAANPGKCVKRVALVWEHETDPFVGKLYAICDGKLRLYENHVLAIKKLATEEEILVKFRQNVEAAKALRAKGTYTGTAPKSVFWQTYNYFKARAKARAHDAKLEADVLSCSK